jgi:hypothetical protein
MEKDKSEFEKSRPRFPDLQVHVVEISSLRKWLEGIRDELLKPETGATVLIGVAAFLLGLLFR